MKPTLDQYLKSAAKWNREHRGVSYQLSHHNISAYCPEGTWCYYLFLRADMFQRADDWALFDKPEILRDGLADDKKYLTFDYYDIPDLEFHGGVTWFSREPYFDRRAAEHRYALKIGCDYNHLGDRECDYWQGLDAVDRDAKRSCDILADSFPLNERCGYSGRMGPPSEFYTAVNGVRVHLSQAPQFTAENWPTWMPAQPPVSTPSTDISKGSSK